jgi:glycosyltransferase involved in cell wall biosynthesis
MIPTFFKGRMLKSFATNWIERVITVSGNNKHYLEANHGIPASKIRVVQIGIPDESAVEPAGIREHLQVPRDSFLLLIAAALEERKGHETAFRALASLPKSVHLLVVGTGSRAGDIRECARDAGVVDRAHFLGHRDDVPALMRDADLLILPSLLEATPYVIIEAMAARLPVVASNIYGIPELLEEGGTGLLAEPGDDVAFAGHIERLMANADLRANMGVAGRKRFEERFTLSESVSKTVAVYEELLGKV